MKKYTFLISGLVLSLGGLRAQDMVKAMAGTTLRVQNGTVLYVNGGIGLDNGSTLVNAGTMTLEKNAGAADFTDHTAVPYNYGSGKFVFTGNGTQGIKTINQLERIEVDNAGLTLMSNIRSNTWYLKSGKINTGAFIAIASAPLATAVQADAANAGFVNSWFNGNLRRYVTPATVNNYQFPVGGSARVNMAELDHLMANPLAGVNYITASFGPKPGTDAGLNVAENGAIYNSINNGGVWYLVPDANPAAGKYDLILNFNGFGLLIENSFGLLRRPDASANGADWIVPANSVLPSGGSPGRTVAGGFARRNNISSFSQWGIGMSAAPLPLQLLNFYAVKKDKAVLLQWNTANEINTSHFELFKGLQPANMQYLDKVTASGTSVNHSYDYMDYKPLQGLSFYQLKMFDKDNSFKLSETVKVNFDNITTLSVYPNPVTNNTIFVNYTGGKVMAIQLIAADGKQIPCGFAAQGSNQLKVAIPPATAKGSYTLQLFTDDGPRNTRILVQ